MEKTKESVLSRLKFKIENTFFQIVIEPDIAELLVDDLNVDLRKVLSLYPR